MVAGVDIPVELQGHVVAALGGVDAGGVDAEHGRESRVDVLDEDAPDVVGHPLVEDGAEELPVGARLDAAGGHRAAGLPVEDPGAGVGAPAGLRGGQLLGLDPLDDRDELQVGGAQLVAEVAVDLGAVVLVGGVDGAQDVAAHAGVHQVPPAAQHHGVGAAAAPVEPVGVVHGGRAVHGDSHEHVVVGQEGGPLLIDEGGVGLQGVDHLLGGAPVGLAQLDEPAEEGQAAQGRLTALPEHGDLSVTAGGQVLGDVGLQGLLAHELARDVVEQLLGQEEAVLAVQVAGGPGRLGDDGQGQAASLERPRRRIQLRGGGPGCRG